MSRRLIIGLTVFALLLSVMTGLAQSSRTTITAANASQLTQLMRLGRGSAEFAAFTPDGTMLAVGGTAGVWLYDPSALATESEPPLLITNDTVNAIAISPDGATLAVSLADGDIVLWDIASQTMTQTLQPEYSTDNMVYSPDGSMLALNSGSGGITLLDLATSTEQRLAGSFRSEAEVAFSPDGQWVAAAGTDNAVYLWNVVTSEAGATLEGHTSTPVSISFSPDSSQVIAGSSDRTIRLWNSADGTEITWLSGIGAEELGRINQVAFSPDGSVFASGDSDGNIVIWSADDHTASSQIAVNAAVNDLAFSADSTQLVAVSDRQYVHLVDVASGSATAVTVGHTDTPNAVTFSPDSSTLAFADYDRNLWLWDTNAMPELNLAAQIEDAGDSSAENISGVAYSSDGSILATVQGFSVLLYDSSTHQLLHELEGDGITEGLAFSPDDTLLAYTSSSGLYVFDVATGQLLASLEAHTDWLNSVAWSPDQTLIATSSSDRTVRVYGLQ